MAKMLKQWKASWEMMIGLEVHCQLLTASKLFSKASTNYFSPPNSNVAFFDASLPGTLPVLNRKCVEAAIKLGLALNCNIASRCSFDRKHYFYSDLPLGYQITQQREPIATNGQIEFVVHDSCFYHETYTKTVGIKQIQLEQDSGKSIHDVDRNRSLVDLNRAGVPLVELVFEPELKSADEAVALVKELSLILQKLKCCSCKMAEGALRVDVNVSMNKPGQPPGTRTEVKNLNSLRSVTEAINYEAERQVTLLESGQSIINETRAYDVYTRKTVLLRDKEVVQDYRFIPEPSLPPVYIVNTLPDSLAEENIIAVDGLKNEIPSLPKEDRDRLVKSYALSLQLVFQLVDSGKLCTIFENLMSSQPSRNPTDLARFLLMNVSDAVKKQKMSLESSTLLHLTEVKIGECFDLYSRLDITQGTTEDVFNLILAGDSRTPSEIVEGHKWWAIKTESEKRSICQRAISDRSYYAKRFAKKPSDRFALRNLIDYAVRMSEKRMAPEEAQRIFNELLCPSKTDHNKSPGSQSGSESESD